METSLDVSPRPGGAKKDVNPRQQIEAGHQLIGFCRTCDSLTEERPLITHNEALKCGLAE